jgi:DNA-binding response OmpR family regulator
MGDADELRTAVIVEDDPDLRHLIASVFESAGFSVVSVGNGLDGVRATLAYKPLITTLDVSMPGIDGFEAARRIRAAGSTTFIMMVSAMAEESDVIQGLGAGADDYIVKPFRPREFRARIDAFLRRPARGEGHAAPMAPVPRQQESVGPSFPRINTSSIPVQAPVHASEPPTEAPIYRGRGAEQFAPAPPVRLPRTNPWPDAEQPAQPVQTIRVIPPEDVDDLGGSFGDVIEGEIDEPRSEVERHDPHLGWMRHRDLYVEPETRRVEIGSTPVDLTETEFELLLTIMSSRRRIRSKADLTLVLRGESYVTSYYVGDADKRAVQSHVESLRRKLGELNAPMPRYLEAVRDVGYRMTPEFDG